MSDVMGSSNAGNGGRQRSSAREDERRPRSGRRGYILTLVVIVILSLLIIYATDAVSRKQYDRAVVQGQFYTEKAMFVVDDISQDMRGILKLDMYANSTQLIFVENMSTNKTSFFSGYSTFLQNFSQLVNANVSFGYSDPLEISLSDGLAYRTNFTNQRIDFFNSSGGTAAVTAYYVTIISSQERGALTPISFAPNGTYIWINYTDLANSSKSFVDSGFVDPAVLNTYEIEYGGGNVFLRFGLINGVQNSYEMEQPSILVLTSHALTVNRTAKDALYAIYNLPLNITMPNTNFTGDLPAN